jgi:uncharacterized protein YdhG (YjbR/CyaY superfamily)
MTVIDAHLERFDETQRAALTATVETIRKALPGAIEVISYAMPTFKLEDAKGPAVIGLDGFARHNSLFPYSGQVLEEFAAELADRLRAKGTIGFDRDRPFPAPLLRRILRARIAEINAGYPKASGQVREFYDNGSVKTAGRIRLGERTGTWVSYDRAGRPKATVRY